MNTLSISNKNTTQQVSWAVSMGRKLKQGISNLFKPEVVEVTFKIDGDHITYTYTKVSEKKVA
jgi:hypothetical protein